MYLKEEKLRGNRGENELTNLHTCMRGNRNFISLTNDFVIVVYDETYLGSQQYFFNFVVNPIYYMTSSVSGQDEPNRAL